MTKILIAADLHLSISEKSYSFSVFDEILENAKNYDALFLLGDTFNTFEDAEKLKEEFSKKSAIYNKNIYLLKGNHEYLKSGGINLSKLKFADNIKIIENIDFINLDNLDILAVAFSENYNIDNDFLKRLENLKEKNRIFLGHGIVEGTLWAIEENEESAFIPIEIIKRVKPNLAIVGHIHKQMEINIENINIIYIGSARVWRKSKSEMGARKCLALNIDCDSITKNYIDLKSAGEYRVYNLNINDIDFKIENIYKNWNYKDIIDINIYGIIEDEILLENKKKEIINKYSKYAREINIKSANLFFLENAYNENIIKEFLNVAEEFESKSVDDEYLEIVELAKYIGIEKISLALQNKK
ncbi:metallophosphoesterase family protein [Brachyspira aalborgi]|uniref:Exonuclease n=1 Tax=Brachyspira aalborgi TaxID=29522 RepID=A0A5C8FWB9_9SPIR|nr:metallophosphoesterase [Brachyspira aalborgi]TXJ53775.1 exonuclease [Brachyspira aalborgi]